MTDQVANKKRAAERIVLLVLLLLAVSAGNSPMIFNDGDVSWHLAAGQWILDHRAVPRVDPFSFTFGGKPWVAFEWLSEIIYARAFGAAGYGGVAAVVVLALLTVHALVIARARRFLTLPGMTILVLALAIALVPFTLARPHVLGWAMFAAWLTILLDARDKKRAPALPWALLMLVWGNMHGSWALGMAVAAALGLEAMIECKWDKQQFVRWLVFGLAALFAAALNASGISGFLHPFAIAQLEHLPLIQEWRPTSPELTPAFYPVLLATLGLILWRGVRLGPVRVLVLVGMLGLALFQVRHQSMLAIAAAFLLPPAFAAAAERGERPPLFGDEAERTRFLRFGAAMAALLIVIRAMMPIAPNENGANPRGLIAAVPAELRDRPVLNTHSFGGPLILAGIKPFIDGRSDMYGDAFVNEFSKALKGDPAALDRIIARWKIEWAMTAHKSDQLIALLDKSPDWKRIYADKVGVIHARKLAPGAVSASGSPQDRRAGR